VSRMHKVLIIDDDRIIRKGLVTTIPWEQHDFQLVGEAADGERGLEIIENCQPHIVISDIKMPFMDGLDMARIAMGRYPAMKFIFLTGYQDFTYAQKAIKVKAVDYLLKPIDKKVLLEKVQKAAGEWDVEQDERQKITQAKPFLRQVLLKKIIECQGKETDLLQEAISLGIELRGQTLLVFLIKIDEYYQESAKKAHDIEKNEYLKFCTCNACEELLQQEGMGGVVELERDELTMIYCSNETKERAEEKSRALAEKIKNTVKKYFRTTLTIALGGAYHGILCVRSSYQEARYAMNCRYLIGKDQVFSIGDVEFLSREDQGVQIEVQDDEFVNKVKLGFVQDALEFLNNLECKMMQQNDASLPYVRLRAVELLISLFRGAAEWAKEWETVQQQSVPIYYSRINRMQTIREIIDLIRQVVCDLGEFVNMQNESQRCGVVESAALYIEEHYASPGLSLQEIGQYVHMNPIYLSVLFKKEKNITFTDFLLQIRMKKAMEMLRCHHMKNYEVAERIGYSSPEYFSVCFKKYTGYSPIEFKNKI
jgi:two-component system, response regulator YesN